MNKGWSLLCGGLTWANSVVRQRKHEGPQGPKEVQGTRWAIWVRSRLKMKGLSSYTDFSISVSPNVVSTVSLVGKGRGLLLIVACNFL